MDVLYNFVLQKIIQNISFYYHKIKMQKVAYVNYSVLLTSVDSEN